MRNYKYEGKTVINARTGKKATARFCFTRPNGTRRMAITKARGESNRYTSWDIKNVRLAQA